MKARKPVFGVGINDYEYSMRDDNVKDVLRRYYDKNITKTTYLHWLSCLCRVDLFF